MKCRFPNDFPEGCPPSEAKVRDIDNAYRAVGNNPPTEVDFRRTKEEQPEKYKSMKDRKKIRANGISFNKEKENLIGILKKIPGLRKNKKSTLLKEYVFGRVY